jgi:hypothetical protein
MKYVMTAIIDGEKKYLDYDGEWTAKKVHGVRFEYLQVLAIFLGFSDGFAYEVNFEEV